MTPREGQVWMLPRLGAVPGPHLVLRSTVEMVRTRMSSSQREPVTLHEILDMETGDLDVWYEHAGNVLGSGSKRPVEWRLL